MPEVLVSIVIPNWNGARLLPACLHSLRKQSYRQIEVIVADNASSDGSQQLIASDFPEVKLVSLSENRGFTGACNAGMAASAGDILVLLNNDTEVDRCWVEEIVAAFGRHPEAGLLASKMLLFDRRDTLHTSGDFYRVNGLPGNRGVWQADADRYNVEEFVFSACGGSAAYRRTMLDAIGMLDDDFFFSCEDVDLAWRAQLAGWRCIYAPRAVVYHHLASTGGGPTASFYDGRNTLWVIAKNYPGKLLWKNLGAIVKAQLRLLRDALRAWRGAAARARMWGILTGLMTIPFQLGKRRTIQSKRAVDLDYIESILAPENVV
jgi:GT2 family glycosyltransferase